MRQSRFVVVCVYVCMYVCVYVCGNGLTAARTRVFRHFASPSLVERWGDVGKCVCLDFAVGQECLLLFHDLSHGSGKLKRRVQMKPNSLDQKVGFSFGQL